MALGALLVMRNKCSQDIAGAMMQLFRHSVSLDLCLHFHGKALKPRILLNEHGNQAQLSPASWSLEALTSQYVSGRLGWRTSSTFLMSPDRSKAALNTAERSTCAAWIGWQMELVVKHGHHPSVCRCIRTKNVLCLCRCQHTGKSSLECMKFC